MKHICPFHGADYIFKTSSSLMVVEEQLGEGFVKVKRGLIVSERAALYGEMIEIVDYSPEIDTNLKVICFQTFVGHCGCILFNLDKMK